MKSDRGVVGLDLSLLGTAAAFLPESWEPGDWKRVVSARCVAEEKGKGPLTAFGKARRLSNIVGWTLNFLSVYPSVHIYVEDYAYGLASKSGLVLAELGGAVKAAIMFERGVPVMPVNQSTVRKYLLGKLPQKNRAAATHEALRKMGAPFDNSDEGDAFCVANYARTELGLPGLTLEGS